MRGGTYLGRHDLGHYHKRYRNDAARGKEHQRRECDQRYPVERIQLIATQLVEVHIRAKADQAERAAQRREDEQRLSARTIDQDRRQICAGQLDHSHHDGRPLGLHR